MVYGYVSCLCCGLQVVRGCVWFQLVCLLFCPFGSSDTACRVPTDCDAKLQYFATALAVFCCLIRFLLFNVVYSPFLIPHSKHPLSVCTPSPYPTATCKQPASKKTTTTLSVYFEFFSSQHGQYGQYGQYGHMDISKNHINNRTQIYELLYIHIIYRGLL